MKHKYICMIVVFFLTMSARAEFAFYESFDGYKEASKTKDNITDITATPVVWSDEAYTSIRSVELLKKYIGLEKITEIKNPKITGNSISRSASGSSVLLFTYKPGPNSWSEQRFKLNPVFLGGEKGLREMWIQYDMFIPDNYQIVDDTPNSGNYFGAGHKVFSLYADAYSYPNVTLVLGGLIARKGTDGKPAYDGNVYQMSTLSTYKNGERIYTQFGIDERKREIMWIDAKKDLGTWQRRTLHFQFPTSEAANDGVVELWIRRADGSIMKVIDMHSGTFFGYAQNYFNAGYINGYYNAGFPNTTFLAIDNFILSATQDAIDTTAISKVNRPVGPSDVKLR